MAAAKLKAAKAGGVTITDEMLALFARGLELQKAGRKISASPAPSSASICTTFRALCTGCSA